MNQSLVEHYFRELLVKGLGFDINDPNLAGTPERISRMYTKELFHAVNKEFPEKEFSKFPNTEKYDQITMMDNIHFVSVCSHHFLPFTGKMWFLYIPGEFTMDNSSELVGASKPARLIAHYAARPQLQENLCHQVLNRFVEVMKPKGVMLVARGIHGCMACRGIQQYDNAGMTTSAIYGAFCDPATRAEAMSLILLSQQKL